MAVVRVAQSKSMAPHERGDAKKIIDNTDVTALVMRYAPERAREVINQNEHAIRCCCPFPDHDDKNPSFRIFTSGPKKGRWVCTPSCGSGNLFDFVMRAEQADFKQALEFLKSLLGGTLDIYFNAESIQAEMRTLMSVKEDDDEFECPQMPHCSRNNKMIAWYMNWRRRYSVNDALKIIERDGLLWCDDQTRYYADKVEGGMCFANSIIIPMHDADGRLVYWQAQYADGRQRKNKMYPVGSWSPTVLPGVDLCVRFGFKWALLVEGYWDLVRGWHYNVPTVATCSAFLNDHQARALYLKFDKLVTGYDNDDAGRAAAELVEKKLGHLIDVSHLPVAHKDKIGKLDIDEMSKEHLDWYLAHTVKSASELELSVKASSEKNQKHA